MRHSIDAVIRPAAVLSEVAAHRILMALQDADVTHGGVWSVTSTLWQRYDQPWNGVAGMRGEAQLAGTLAVMYDSPQRHSITVYRASITERGAELGWTPTSLCDEAFAYADLTLADCPRAPLQNPPTSDPFYQSEQESYFTSGDHI